MMMMIGKRLIANQFPLSKAMLPLALAFTLKSHITFPNFCTQISTPSTTPPGRGVVTEFLINNCGLTPGDIAKAFRRNKDLLSQESCRNLKEVLELLKGCGLTTPAQIRRVVICDPCFLFRSAETNIQSKLSLLRTFMKEEDIAKLVITNAQVFTRREDELKSAISLLQRLGVKDKELSELVAREPLLLSVSEEKVLESFKQAEDLGCQKESEIFARVIHIILGTGKEKIERRLQFLRSLDFSGKQVLELLRRWPMILEYSEENVKHHVDFLVKSVGFPLDYLVKHPALFGYSLEKRLIPRYRVMEALKSMEVLKTELICPSIFSCTEKRFLEIYVNKNAESSILRDIYHSGKVNDTMPVWTHKPDGSNPSLDDTILMWTRKPERPGKAISDAPAPDVKGEEGPVHVCIEEGGIIHQVFAEGKLVGTYEGNPFKVPLGRDTIPLAEGKLVGTYEGNPFKVPFGRDTIPLAEGKLVGTYESNPFKVPSGRDTVPVKFFHLIIGPVQKQTYNRCIILEKGRTVFPEASLIVAEAGSERTPGQTCYHVGIKLPHRPKKRLVYFQLYRAFPQLRQDQLQLHGRSGWRRLCNRIRQEDPEHLSWKEETPKYLSWKEETPKYRRGRRKLNSFFKPPRRSRREVQNCL